MFKVLVDLVEGRKEERWRDKQVGKEVCAFTKKE